MKLIIQTFIKKILGTMIRHGLSGLGVWMAAKGIGTLDDGSQANITELIIGGIFMVISFLWSVIRSHITSKQIADLTAMASKYGFFGMQRRDDPPPPSIPPAAMMLFAAFMSAAVTGCAVMSNFDQNTYNSASALKSESLALIAHANTPASESKAEIDALKAKLSAQLAYEQGKGKTNIISAKQWEILISPEYNLLGKLLESWEAGKKFSAPYLTEKSQQISDAFDQILRLEGAKTK